MTYIDLLNHVLRRLREDEVATITADAYTTMVGDLINDAMRIVQDAWSWAALRQELTITTVADTKTYTLTDWGTDFNLHDIRNDTSNFRMRKMSKTLMDRKYDFENPTSGVPRYFAFSGADADGDMQIDLYQTPDDAYDLKLFGAVRQDDLVATTDVIKVPWKPVLYYALTLAVRERGETGGTSVAEYQGMAEMALNDAIANEEQHFREEGIFEVV